MAESFDDLKAEHEALLQTSAQAIQDLEAANTRISELNEQLGARPSIPLNVTDPALSLSNQPGERRNRQTDPCRPPQRPQTQVKTILKARHCDPP